MFHLITDHVAREQQADRLREANRRRLENAARRRSDEAHRRELERVRASILLVPDSLGDGTRQG